MGSQAVILAGGKGSRLGPLTADTPKPLLEIGGRPFIAHLIDELKRFGFDRQVVLVGPFASEFANALGDRSEVGVQLTLTPEPAPAGTAGALVWAASQLDRSFLLLNGDSLFDFNWLSLTVPRVDEPWIAVCALRRHENASRYGSIELEGERIVRFDEKSRVGPGLINGGVYWLKREILDYIETQPCSLETDVMPQLAAAGLLRGRVYDGEFIDIGTPQAFRRARKSAHNWTVRPAVFIDGAELLTEGDPAGIRPEAVGAVRQANDRSYLVFVMTDRLSAIEAGAFYQCVNDALRRCGAHVDAVYARTDVRVSPITQALNDWPIDPGRSIIVGGQEIDRQVGQDSGVRRLIDRLQDLKDF